MAALSNALFALTTALLMALGGAAAVWSVPPADGDVVIVVSPPWSGGVEAIIDAADGWVVGPEVRWFSALATGTSAELLRARGAWLVLPANPAWLFLCGQGPLS